MACPAIRCVNLPLNDQLMMIISDAAYAYILFCFSTTVVFCIDMVQMPAFHV